MYSCGTDALASSLRTFGDWKTMTANTPTLTESVLNALVDEARKAAQHSYSPYSQFKVGAALRLTNGQVVTGTNVENVSFGLTICAERSALVSAVPNSDRRFALKPSPSPTSIKRQARPAALAARCSPSSSCPMPQSCFKAKTACAQ